MANDTSTKVDVEALSTIADTFERAVNNYQAQVPLCAQNNGINLIKNAKFPSSFFDEYDFLTGNYAERMLQIARNIRSYVASVNGNDEKIEEEMPEEDDTVEEENEKTVPENMEEGTTEEVEESRMDDAEDDRDRVSSGSNKGDSGTYRDGTENENKEQLDNVNNGNETQEQEAEDVGKTRNEKKDLKDINPKKIPFPEDIINKFFASLTNGQIEAILSEMNKGETKILGIEDMAANDRYLVKIRNIIKNYCNNNKEVINGIKCIDNARLRKILPNALLRPGTSTAVNDIGKEKNN